MPRNPDSGTIRTVPLTAAEAAAGDAEDWERRGLLGRLVRLDAGGARPSARPPRR